jgi:hypothetical protein
LPLLAGSPLQDTNGFVPVQTPDGTPPETVQILIVHPRRHSEPQRWPHS